MDLEMMMDLVILMTLKKLNQQNNQNHNRNLNKRSKNRSQMLWKTKMMNLETLMISKKHQPPNPRLK